MRFRDAKASNLKLIYILKKNLENGIDVDELELRHHSCNSGAQLKNFWFHNGNNMIKATIRIPYINGQLLISDMFILNQLC